MADSTKYDLQPNMGKILRDSPGYDPLYAEIWDKYARLQAETSQRITKELRYKRFYLGTHSEHYDEMQELDDKHPIVNYTAAIVNKYADLLTAGEMPGLQVVSPDESPEMKANAYAAEALLYRVLTHNNFEKKIHYGAVDGSMLGDTFFHVYWDSNKTFGGKKGSICVDTVSPFFTRVGFAKNNWDDIEYWITEYRLSPQAVKEYWGIDVEGNSLSDSVGASTGSSPNAPFDGTPVEASKTYIPMVTVVEYHDNKKNAVMVSNNAAMISDASADHHGLFHIRNRTAPNEPWGYPDLYNIMDTNQHLNKLKNKALQIIESHAAPIIVDKGGVLQGRRIKSRANTVVTTMPYMSGEGLEYLQWNGNIFPVDKAIEETKQEIFDISEMPVAAFGNQQPGTSSGFALQIQMQPTLMRVKIKQSAEWGPNLKAMYQYILKLILENDKSVKLPKEVADYDIKIHWNSPLPRDDAREIQNAVALIQNKLTSRETAMQSLQVENIPDEMKQIDEDTISQGQVEAQVQKGLLDVQMEAQQSAQQGQVQGQGETALNSPIGAGQAPEQAFPKLNEEKRATTQSTGLDQGESIAPTSLGGG